jgi:hypothetical protein
VSLRGVCDLRRPADLAWIRKATTTCLLSVDKTTRQVVF